MNSVIILLIVSVSMWGVQRLHIPAESILTNDAPMVLGFLILAAFFGGKLTSRLNLPRITGYILVGLVCGPWILKFVTQPHLEKLTLIDELALALIAFTAGAELNLSHLKKQIRSISLIILMQAIITFSLVSIAIYFSRPLIAVLADQPIKVVWGFCCIIAVICIAKSPAETIAVIVETRAKGKMTDTVLGITVVKDVIVIILFTIALSTIKSMINPGETLSFSSLTHLSIEIISSIIAGLGFGGLIILYFKYVRQEALIFILGFVFFITEISHQLHLEFLLTCITTGFVVQTFSKYGHDFLETVEKGSLPVYLVFFSIAGATLNLPVLYDLWHIAVIIVATRILSVYLGTYSGARLAGDDHNIRHFAWAGFIGQAGVSLGFAIIIQDQLPGIGETIKNIVIATIVLNLMLGPALFKWALQKSGEAAPNPSVINHRRDSRAPSTDSQPHNSE